jgi:hypothetical protein
MQDNVIQVRVFLIIENDKALMNQLTSQLSKSSKVQVEEPNKIFLDVSAINTSNDSLISLLMLFRLKFRRGLQARNW